MSGDNEKEGYSWEGSFERSWDSIREDESGALQLGVASDDIRKRRRLEVSRSVRKGIIRYTYIVMDLSKSMSLKDWKPHRCGAVSEAVQGFVKDYFDQNPISQLGLITLKSSRAERISDLSSNPKMHVEKLKPLTTASGEPSLQNALELVKTSLKIVPSYGSREAIIVYGSLTTSDPSDIFTTIASLKKENIRCSVIGIGAEMHLLKKIAQDTNGTYFVAKNISHFKELLNTFTVPAPTVSSKSSRFASLVQMGFPERKKGVISLCACHQSFTTEGYYCPRCRSKGCELPSNCSVCNLSLISSPHLARSYHHLFPIENFTEIPIQNSAEKKTCWKECFGCMAFVDNTMEKVYTCPTCKNSFCGPCDLYIHESLHNCPGCLGG